MGETTGSGKLQFFRRSVAAGLAIDYKKDSRYFRGVAAWRSSSLPRSRCAMTSIHRLLGLLLVAVLVAGCSSAQDLGVAQAEVTRFRQLMAEQKFTDIYSAGSDDLKKVTTEQDLTRLLAAIDRKLGAVKTAEPNGWNVNYNSGGTFVTLNFKTRFERGTGAETFKYRITGGKALLAGYNIQSNDLMIN
jgi:hypothetical protein